MGKWVLPILALAAAVFILGNRLQSKEPPQKCAFITEASGKAVLSRGGKFYLVSGMEGIHCGEVIKVLPGAKVVVANCGANLKTEITGPAEFSIAPQKLVFKNGKAGNNTKIDAELCPFFQEQAFSGQELAQVDPDGSNPEKYATFVIKDFNEPPLVIGFSGYISEIKGDVFYSRPRVLKITGEVVPTDGMEVFSRPDAGYSIYSCAEGKKYRVEGSALIRFTPGKPEIGPVTFLTGKAASDEPLDRAKCEASLKAIKEARPNNLKPVGLDGK